MFKTSRDSMDGMTTSVRGTTYGHDKTMSSFGSLNGRLVSTSVVD